MEVFHQIFVSMFEINGFKAFGLKQGPSRLSAVEWVLERLGRPAGARNGTLAFFVKCRTREEVLSFVENPEFSCCHFRWFGRPCAGGAFPWSD